MNMEDKNAEGSSCFMKNSIDNAVKEDLLGSHNPLVHEWNSSSTSKNPREVANNEPDF